MSDSPVVSVVLSVHSEATHVKKTIDSVLAQQNIDFEFIIVSDGAEQSVIDVVTQYNDDRIYFIEQKNQGLTKALINGCKHARSPFIARIDAGDCMLEDRLSIQAEALQSNDDLGLVASWVDIETEEGYFLYTMDLNQSQLVSGLKARNNNDFCSPFHASVMMRKSVYESVGGYRSDFYFAQDCDLWTRIIDVCDVDVIQKKLTKGIFSYKGISGKHADQQKQLLSLILQAREQRLNGHAEDDMLAKAHRIRPEFMSNDNTPLNNFSGLYFIAKVLTDNRSEHAFDYWKRVIRIKPFSLKSWVFLFISFKYR